VIANFAIIFIFAIFVVIILTRFYIYVYIFPLLKKIKYSSTSPLLTEDKNNVSIIITARNEAENLKKFLPSILNQKYKGDFEVIVVLDTCTDNSKRILLDFQEKYDNLYFTEVFQERKFDKYKKLAILIGVKAAKYENLLFIDADCNPSSNKWLEAIAEKFDNYDLILGYGGIFKEKGFTNLIYRYDTVYNAALYLSAALRGKPYMAVGRNMAYKKHLFNKVGGFKKHYHLPSGNDDLFVKDVAKHAKTTICIKPEAFVYTYSPKKLKELFFKKIRHTSISKYYRTKTKIFLAVDSLSRMIFFPYFIFSLIFLIATQVNLAEILLYLTVAKALAEIIVLKPVFKHFNEEKLFWTSTFTNMFLPAFVGLGMIYGRIKKNTLKRWL
jgi:glycosyltransferase involved in cell wall biosynthesis